MNFEFTGSSFCSEKSIFDEHNHQIWELSCKFDSFQLHLDCDCLNRSPVFFCTGLNCNCFSVTAAVASSSIGTVVTWLTLNLSIDAVVLSIADEIFVGLPFCN